MAALITGGPGDTDFPSETTLRLQGFHPFPYHRVLLRAPLWGGGGGAGSATPKAAETAHFRSALRSLSTHVRQALSSRASSVDD